MKTRRAVAFCRVSSFEQLQNGSLTHQQKMVLRAANELQVEIPDEYWWSGNVSSKRGTNVKRKDLNEALALCRKDKSIKYAIVNEPDRFMRSIAEAMYFEVEFQKLGVTIWYAGDPELNTGDMSSKLLKFVKYFRAEGSNEERQSKSITGLTEAIEAGRWPFQPKAGYRKGSVNAVPEIDTVRGLPLREAMLSMIEHRATPTEALKTLNKSTFIKPGHAKYKMDKFRAMCTHSFYAGVVEMNKQVKKRNENGLHKPLITMEQHLRLVDIFAKKKKAQSGPRKNGNPEYPLSNIVHCQKCEQEKYGRYVGFPVNNGKNKERVYHKYRCRSCGEYFTRDDLHGDVSRYIGEYQITEYGRKELVQALNAVWKARRKTAEAEKLRLARDITSLRQLIDNRVDAAIQPENQSIKGDIMRKIEDDKLRLIELERQHENYDKDDLSEKERFITFALEYAENMERHFIKLPKPRLLKCKQMLFPAGFWINENKKVYTPELSILTRLASNKKDLPNPEKSFMVRVRRL